MSNVSSHQAARRERARRSVVPLDSVHRRMLELLRDDGRMSVAALAGSIGISRANAYNRLEWLKQQGVITGFSARVDSRRVGLGITAVILVSVTQPAFRPQSHMMAAVPEIEWCAVTTGAHDLLMVVRAPDIETLRDVILERLQAMPHVRATQTMFVLDELVRRPYVL